jgi:hypothetical protein
MRKWKEQENEVVGVPHCMMKEPLMHSEIVGY